MHQELFNILSALEMEAETARLRGTEGADMTPYDAARLVSILALSNKAKTIVEVGAGVGYVTLWLAYAASRTGGRVIACEIDPTRAETARANLEKAGLSDIVELLVGDARDLLRQREEPVDFLFIDGENSQYETYFDVVYKQMGIGSMVVANRTIADEYELADYITYVQNHPSLESVTIPVGDGLEVSVKTST